MTIKARAEKRREAKAASNGHLQVLNGDIFTAKEPLLKLMAKELPVRTSFELARLANTLNGHLQAIDTVRNQLVKKYGQPVPEHPGSFQVPPDGEEYGKFIAEMNGLFSLAVDLAAEKVILPASMDSSLAIEPSVLMSLLKFVDIEEQVKS